MENIFIRDYRAADYPAITDLWLKTGLGGAHRGDDQKIIEKSIKMGGKLLVAESDDGRILATSWMTFDGRRIHLHHFGVMPSFQKRGIGRKLAIESINFAKKKGFQMKLEVHKTNTEAIQLYSKLGFSYLGDYLVYIIRHYEN
ncbi:MAG: N-acetyltransferase family protein [Bacteroidales bacterium]